VKSALERAADLFGRARFPVFGGLFTDTHGAAAALALAEKLGGGVDHAASTGLMRASRVMRETGATPASFGEVRNRADTVVDDLPANVRKVSNLAGITRELTLSELAVITRGAPARLLGLIDRRHLGPGAVAAIAVCTEQKNKTAMFAAADLVFKSGVLVVRDGKVVRVTWGRCSQVEPGFDAQIKRRLSAFYNRYYGADPSWFGVTEAITHRPDCFATVPCLN